jgi:hypothetical protein
MAIVRVKLKWTGWSGAPGYSNFYFSPNAFGEPLPATVDSMFARVDQFSMDIGSMLPPAVKLQVQGDIDLIDPLNGEMEGAVAHAAGTLRSGTGANGSYSAASGAVITWRTGSVVAGRRLRGRTFVVPLIGTAFGIDGTLSGTAAATIGAAAAKIHLPHADYAAVVWARPAKERVRKDGTVVPARDGDVGDITSSNVPTLAAVLRSRRD